MPSSDRTADFRNFIREKKLTIPDAKRRKPVRFNQSDAALAGQGHFEKEYLSEAYIVLNHINTLTRMLANIRKPYLNVDTRTTPMSRQAPSNIDFGGADPLWAGIRYLTNEERDQIDLQARVILTRCSDRVKEMEALEKRRTELVASKTNPLTRLLPARLRQDVSTVLSDFLAAHHSSITWYLGRRLAEASQTQKEMQEERVKRQLERTRTLGSSATREALTMESKEPTPVLNQQGGSWLGEASSSLIAATIGAPPPNEFHRVQPIDAPSSSDDEEEIELSASQILQFETENANILKTVQDTLESVQQAESRLMEISAIQMELVTHLTKQTELTDQLYEDAIATTATVEKGNVQLREAKQRAKDGRLFILLFLIGASLSLLFLHYY
ncbi:snare protein syntaxin 18/UFE1 [Tricholoma matsutake]|nr:snare protein syntaxin 18/UFE1 [Tricholoma matsutake 945]